jgi:hypothetical protein
MCCQELLKRYCAKNRQVFFLANLIEIFSYGKIPLLYFMGEGGGLHEIVQMWTVTQDTMSHPDSMV